jgi:malonyl-CoA/methylmalonyl-CoA synthetase
MNNNLYLRFKNQTWVGERSFIRTVDGGVITYTDADLRSAQLALALQAWRVQPGDRVVVQVEKSATALLLYLACLRSALSILPLILLTPCRAGIFHRRCN